jgi:uncharacterized protein YjbI with pentapeptide repeats
MAQRPSIQVVQWPTVATIGAPPLVAVVGAILADLSWLLAVGVGILVLLTTAGWHLWWTSEDRRQSQGSVGAALMVTAIVAALVAVIQIQSDLRLDQLSDERNRELRASDARRAREVERQTLALSLGQADDLSGINLSGRDLTGFQLARKNLAQADLRGAHLARANLVGARLRGANLAGADLRGARLIAADLRTAELSGAHLDGALLILADLRGARMHETVLSGAKLLAADLGRAPAITADGQSGAVDGPHTELVKARLDGASLIAADLDDADLTRAVLTKADLRSAVLRGAKLTGADLSRAKLQALDDRELVQLARGGQPIVLFSTDDDFDRSRWRRSTIALGTGVSSFLAVIGRRTDLDGAIVDATVLTATRFDARTRWPVALDPAARGAIGPADFRVRRAKPCSAFDSRYDAKVYYTALSRSLVKEMFDDTGQFTGCRNLGR